MKKLIIILFILFLSTPVYAGFYGIYRIFDHPCEIMVITQDRLLMIDADTRSIKFNCLDLWVGSTETDDGTMYSAYGYLNQVFRDGVEEYGFITILSVPGFVIGGMEFDDSYSFLIEKDGISETYEMEKLRELP